MNDLLLTPLKRYVKPLRGTRMLSLLTISKSMMSNYVDVDVLNPCNVCNCYYDVVVTWLRVKCKLNVKDKRGHVL